MAKTFGPEQLDSYQACIEYFRTGQKVCHVTTKDTKYCVKGSKDSATMNYAFDIDSHSDPDTEE